MQRADDIRAAFCHAKNLCTPEKNNTPKPKVTTAPPAVLPTALQQVPVVPEAEAAVKQLSMGCASGKYAGLGAHHAYVVGRPTNSVSPIRPTKVAAAKAATNQVKGRASAQVALSVGQQVVGQEACGLKPEESKPFRITVRFSESEREILVRRAENVRLTVSEYIRSSVLGAGYVSAIDPAKRDILQKISRELGRQGTNLNQIAKHMNAGNISEDQSNSTLAIMARSLLSVHQTVRQALAEGRSAP